MSSRIRGEGRTLKNNAITDNYEQRPLLKLGRNLSRVHWTHARLGLVRFRHHNFRLWNSRNETAHQHCAAVYGASSQYDLEEEEGYVWQIQKEKERQAKDDAERCKGAVAQK